MKCRHAPFGRFGLLLALGVTAAGCRRTPPPQAEAPPPAVTVSRPVVREVVDYNYFTGRTAAVEAVGVRARVSGYLAKVAFREGAEVEKGDLLFEIDPRPYRATLEQAQGNLAAAQARLRRQDADLARARKLAGTGAMSREEFDKIVGDRGESAGSLESLKAAVARARLDLDYTKVNAPIRGRVDRALVTVGNLVTADQTLLTTLVTLDPIYAYFDVDEQSVLRYQQLIREKKVRSARDAKVPVYLGLSSEQGYPHEGVIDFVGNQLDVGTGTLRVRGVFPNEDRVLTPGLFVRVRVPYSRPHEALLVPERALGADQRGQYVLVVNADDVVEYRPVTAGQSVGGLIVIEKGLSANDWVVVRGVQLARPGSKVEPERAPAGSARR